MKDITSPGWIKFKGILFLMVGLISVGLLFFEHPELKVALYLIIAVWCFCRFYYFAFYVIEHYVDPSYRFSGLLSFARYLLTRRADRN
jgi:hypothetical protein